MTAYRELDEDEDWGDDDTGLGDDSDDEPTVPCPSCRRDILEDTPRCPYCERYISAEDRAGPDKPIWVIVTAIVCLAVAVWWLFAAF
ncbi:MAG: hypothetical protein K8S94_07380 [Planctomycetia bacterium]|nr:hypothetical protein [Planctomycetia bacterium]